MTGVVVQLADPTRIVWEVLEVFRFDQFTPSSSFGVQAS